MKKKDSAVITDLRIEVAKWRGLADQVPNLTEKIRLANSREISLREEVTKLQVRMHGIPVEHATMQARIGELEQLLQTEMTKDRRKRMPDERPSLTHHFVIHAKECDVNGYITVGLYPGTEPPEVGEVFVKLDRAGSTSSGFIDVWAIAVSMLVQSGTPLEKLIAKFRGVRFEPSGRTSTPAIRSCTSAVDYVMRYLDIRFIRRLFVDEPLPEEEQ